MIISRHNIEKLLPDFKNISDEDFVVACNSVGMEVEQILTYNSPKGLVIGEIINVQKHPDSDKLHICTVNVGQKEPIVIVCGAPNVRVKWKCIVALQETKLFDGKVIFNREVRGVMSQGMICGYGEITSDTSFISKDDENGVVLLKKAIIGDKNIAQYIGLDDTVYEITTPSDRNDLNGSLAFCQEIAKYFGFKFNLDFENEINGKKIEMPFAHSNFCNYFSLSSIGDINIEPSDWNVKRELMHSGIRPINNVIDQLSLITVKTNIPSTAYDADLLPSKNLEVERLNTQTTITGVDGKLYQLLPGDIVVKSGSEIVSIAGVIGVDKYKVTEKTKNILVEFANFDYYSVRTTAIRLDCLTDAAKRLSKRISTWLNKKSIMLLQDNFQSVSTVYSGVEAQGKEIEIDPNLLSEFLDLDITFDEAIDILKKSNFKIQDKTVYTPKYRTDLNNQQDLFEEILKIIDFNKLENKAITSEFVISELSKEHLLISQLKQYLNSNYFQEIKSYNLTSEREVNNFNVFKIDPIYKIENCNNENRAILRTNLIDSLLKIYEFNSSYKNELQPIFEIQKIYSTKVNNNLSAIVEEKKVIDQLNKSEINFNIVALKSLICGIGAELNTVFDFYPINENEHFYEDESFAIHNQGHLIGYVGLIKNKNLKKYSLGNKKIYCLTMNLDLCLKNYQKKTIQVKQFNNLIPITRDISFTSKKERGIKEIISELKTLKFVKEFKFIDRFKNKNGEISYTIRLRFNNEEKMTSNEIDSHIAYIMNKINIQNCM